MGHREHILQSSCLLLSCSRLMINGHTLFRVCLLCSEPLSCIVMCMGMYSLTTVSYYTVMCCDYVYRKERVANMLLSCYALPTHLLAMSSVVIKMFYVILFILYCCYNSTSSSPAMHVCVLWQLSF